MESSFYKVAGIGLTDDYNSSIYRLDSLRVTNEWDLRDYEARSNFYSWYACGSVAIL